MSLELGCARRAQLYLADAASMSMEDLVIEKEKLEDLIAERELAAQEAPAEEADAEVLPAEA